MALLLGKLEPGSALDAACGTGRQAAVLAELGHRVLGVDATPEMLERARERVPQAEFRIGSLTDLPAESASFDLAVCSLALTHLEEPAPAIAELARAVRPAGRIVISDVHPTWIALGAQAAYRVDDKPAGTWSTTCTGTRRTCVASGSSASRFLTATSCSIAAKRSISGRTG
jgi:ubiquinone/menaquinone biosynthesis C-methylase UbiE